MLLIMESIYKLYNVKKLCVSKYKLKHKHAHFKVLSKNQSKYKMVKEEIISLKVVQK
jgi:hypothetical protein